jgi:hypothetical protein
VSNISGIAVAEVLTGFVLLWSGAKNATIKDTLTSFLKGTEPAANPTGAPTIGVGEPAAGSTAAGTSSTAAANAPAADLTGTAAANEALGKVMAAAYGWATGTEWTDLNNIVMAESGWRNTAQNPTSTAYGIFQFLDSTWASVGYSKTSDPATQIAAGLKYIKTKYGDPIKAWAFHLANGYY